jgi:hypothetical protein
MQFKCLFGSLFRSKLVFIYGASPTINAGKSSSVVTPKALTLPPFKNFNFAAIAGYLVRFEGGNPSFYVQNAPA